MSDNFTLIEMAVERNLPVTIEFPSAGLVRSFSSRFLAVEKKQTILLESIRGQDAAIDALVASKERVTVSFRSDTQKVEFATPLIERRRGHRLNATTLIEAILLQKPEKVKAVQRRSNYRVSVPGDGPFKFKFWRIAEQDELAAIPPAGSEMRVAVRDLSSGGIGGTWKRRKEDPRTLATQQRLRVEIEGMPTPMLLEARLSFIQTVADPDNRRIGVKFTLNPNSIPDRQMVLTLNKLMQELQQAELKRKRLVR